MGLVRTHISGVESGREAGRVRRGCRVMLVKYSGNYTRVGDADVSGRSEGGVTTGYTRPFWVDTRTDVRV